MPAFLLPFLGAAASGLGNGVGFLAGGAMGLGSFVGHSALAAGQMIGGAVLSAISGALRLMVSLPGLIFGTLRGLLGNMLGVLGSTLGVVTKVGVAFLGLAGGGVAAIGKALQIAAQSALDFAKDAAQLRGMTGLSYGQSGAVLRNFGAFGMGSAETSSTFSQNPALFRMKAGLFGLPGFEDASFIPQLAQTFKRQMSGGLMGQLMADAMMSTLGINSPQMRAMANLPQGAINSQLNYSNSLNATLGLGPEQIRRYAEEVPLFIGRVGIFWDSLKMKVAGEVLPVLEMGLNFITNLAAQNAGNIGGWIEDGVEWLFVKAPLIAMKGVNLVLGVVQKGVNSLLGFTQMLATGLPKWLGGAVNWVSDALLIAADKLAQFGPKFIAGVGDALTGVTHLIAGWMRSLANGIDAFAQGQSPFYTVLNWVAQGVDLLTDMFRQTAAVFAFLAADIQTALTAMPISWITNRLGVTNLQPRDPVTAYNDALNAIPQSTLALDLSQASSSPTLGKWSKGLRKNADALDQWGVDASNWWQSHATSALNNTIGGLTGAANWLSPRDKNGNPLPNKGEQAGAYLGGHFQGIADALAQDIKPNLDNLANAAQGYQKRLGTERERADRWEELIAATKGVEKAIRETAANGGELPQGLERIIGYAAAAVGEMQGRGILNQ